MKNRRKAVFFLRIVPKDQRLGLLMHCRQRVKPRRAIAFCRFAKAAAACGFPSTLNGLDATAPAD
jgi:hypothetical protein